MQQTEFFLHKKNITDKIYELLGLLSTELKQTPVHQNFDFPKDADHRSGKISKGENYQGLPFIILDFPRLFTRNDIFAFRSWFWWGKCFNFTLHLSGASLDRYAPFLLANIDQLRHTEVYYCMNANPWQHEIVEGNYVLIDELNDQALQKQLTDHGFIKICRELKLERWEDLLTVGRETYELFLSTIQ